MLNFLFTFYVCLIPLLLLWACGLGFCVEGSSKSRGSKQTGRNRKRPVTALKLAANEKRRSAKVYSSDFSKMPEYYEISQASKRRVTYLPGVELNLITAENSAHRRETARSAG